MPVSPPDTSPITAQSMDPLDEVLQGYMQAAREIRSNVMGVPADDLAPNVELEPWSSDVLRILMKINGQQVAMAMPARMDIPRASASGKTWTGGVLSVEYLKNVVDEVYSALAQAITTGRDVVLHADHQNRNRTIRRVRYTLNGAALSNPKYRRRFEVISPFLRPLVLTFFYVESRSLDPYALSRDWAKTKGICQAMDSTWRGVLKPVVKSKIPPNAYGSIHLAVLFAMIYMLNSLQHKPVMDVARRLQERSGAALADGLIRMAQILWSLYNAGSSAANASRAVARWWGGRRSGLPGHTVNVSRVHVSTGARIVLSQHNSWVNRIPGPVQVPELVEEEEPLRVAEAPQRGMEAAPKRVVQVRGAPGRPKVAKRIPPVPAARRQVPKVSSTGQGRYGAALRDLLGVPQDSALGEGDLIEGAVRLYQAGYHQETVQRAIAEAHYLTASPDNAQMMFARRIDALARLSVSTPAAKVGRWPSTAAEPPLFGSIARSGVDTGEPMRSLYREPTVADVFSSLAESQDDGLQDELQQMESGWSYVLRSGVASTTLVDPEQELPTPALVELSTTTVEPSATGQRIVQPYSTTPPEFAFGTTGLPVTGLPVLAGVSPLEMPQSISVPGMVVSAPSTPLMAQDMPMPDVSVLMAPGIDSLRRMYSGTAPMTPDQPESILVQWDRQGQKHTTPSSTPGQPVGGVQVRELPKMSVPPRRRVVQAKQPRPGTLMRLIDMPPELLKEGERKQKEYEELVRRVSIWRQSELIPVQPAPQRDDQLPPLSIASQYGMEFGGEEPPEPQVQEEPVRPGQFREPIQMGMPIPDMDTIRSLLGVVIPPTSPDVSSASASAPAGAAPVDSMPVSASDDTMLAAGTATPEGGSEQSGSLRTEQVKERLQDKLNKPAEQVAGAYPMGDESSMVGRDLGGTGWHDFLHTMPHGRLLSCFPAYCVMLVYGGRWIRKWRFWDQFYGTFSIASIDVFRSRFSPTHQAQVMISNMFNALGNAAAAHLIDQMVARGYQWLEWDPAEDLIGAGGALEQWWRGIQQMLFPHIGEYERNVYELEFRSLFVKPGTRLHIRMGYGANAAALPVLFNGTIGEVRFEDNMIVLSALGDGAELEKPIRPTDRSERERATYYRVSGLFGMGIEPRQVIVDLFASPRRDAVPVLGPIIYSVSGAGYLNSNLFGINNFGLVGVNRYLRGIINTPHPGETCVNVYSSAPLAETYSAGYYGVVDLFLLLVPGLDDMRPGIRVSLDVKNGTIWDVINATRLPILDYIISVEPFDLHSTLFFGRRDYPLYYTYMNADEIRMTEWWKSVDSINLDDLNKVMRYKQFQQYHFVSSDENLISCRISLSYERVVTDCVTRDSSGFPGNNVMFDPMVVPEDRREIVYDSALNTTAIDLLLPGSRNASLISLLSRMWPIRNILQTDKLGLAMPVREVNNISANIIRESMMDIYQGELVMAGMPSVKPWDIIFLQDQMRMMVGPVGVKEVQHHFSVERGFITSVTPDLVSVGISDKETFLLYRAWAIAGNAMAFYGLTRQIAARASLEFWAARGGMFQSTAEVAESFYKMRTVVQMNPRKMGDEMITVVKELSEKLKISAGPDGRVRIGQFGQRWSAEASEAAMRLKDKLRQMRDLLEHIEDTGIRAQLERLIHASEYQMDQLEKALHDLQDADLLVRNMMERIREQRSAGAAEEVIKQLTEELRKLIDTADERFNRAGRSLEQLKIALQDLASLNIRLTRLVGQSWHRRMQLNFGKYWRDVARTLMKAASDVEALATLRGKSRVLARAQRRSRLKMAAVGMLTAIRDVVKAGSGAIARTFLDTSHWGDVAGNLINRIRNGVTIRPLQRNIGELLRGGWKGLGGVFRTTFSRGALLLMGVGHFLELINRYINSMYVCWLFPVMQAGKPFLAGLRGHAGTVYGDNPGTIQEVLALYNRGYGKSSLMSTARVSPWADAVVMGFINMFVQREHNPIADWDLFHDDMPVTGSMPAQPFQYGSLRVTGSVASTVPTTTAVGAMPRWMSEWELDSIRNSETELERALEESRQRYSAPVPTLATNYRGDLCDFIPESDYRLIATLEPRAQVQAHQFLRRVREELRRQGYTDVGVYVTSARRNRIQQRALFASKYPTLDALNRAAKEKGIRPYTQAEWNVYRKQYPAPNPYPVAAESPHERGIAFDVGFFTRGHSTGGLLVGGSILATVPVERYSHILDKVARELGLRRVKGDPVHVEAP